MLYKLKSSIRSAWKKAPMCRCVPMHVLYGPVIVLLWHRILTEGRCRQYDGPAQCWSCGRSSGNCCSLGKASEETTPCGRWSQGSSRPSCTRHWSKLWSRWRWLIFDLQTADNDSSSNSVRCILTTQSLHESSHNFRLPDRTSVLKDKNIIMRMFCSDYLHWQFYFRFRYFLCNSICLLFIKA